MKAKKERGIHSVGRLTIKEQGKAEQIYHGIYRRLGQFLGAGKNSDNRNDNGNSEDGKISAFPYEKGLHETSIFAQFSTFFPRLGKF